MTKLLLPALLAVTGGVSVVAGVVMAFGAPAGLIVAGVALVGFALLWERA